MTAFELIAQAAADGVELSLTPSGRIRLGGEYERGQARDKAGERMP